MTDPVSCEQVLLAWSSSNLVGTSGIGPVASSPGWALSARDATAGLGDAGRYLAEGANAALAEGREPPVCLEFRPGETATLLVAKVYASGSARAGHYQVHALRDSARVLSPWDLWRQASLGVLKVTQDAPEEPGPVPVVEVVPVTAPVATLSESEGECLAVLLECLADGSPFLVRTSDQGAGERLLRRLLSVLPLPLLRQFPVSTLVMSPAAWRRGAGLLVPPFSQGFERVTPDADLDAGELRTLRRPDAGLAAALAAAPRDEVAELASVAQLRSWLALRTGSVADLDAQALAGAVRGPLAQALLRRLAGDPSRGAVLGRIVADPGLASGFATTVARSGPGDIACLFAGAGPRVQRWLVDAVGDGFAAVVPELVRRTGDEVVVVESPAFADALARVLRPGDGLFDFAYAVTTSTWTQVSAAQLVSVLRDGAVAVSEDLWRVAASAPGKVAVLLDALSREAGADAGALLRRWPDAHLAAGVEAVLRMREAPPAAVFELLSGRRESVAGPVLRERWPELSAHVGIPADVAALVEVKKRGWWR